MSIPFFSSRWLQRRFLLVLLVGLSVGACWSDGGPSSSPTPALSPTPTPTSSESPTPTQAEVSVWPQSATEADVEVRLHSAQVLLLRFGAGDLARSMSSPSVSSYSFFLYGLEPSTQYQYELSSQLGVLATGSFSTAAAETPPFVVLFDNAHAQTAGNADWVIDDNAPDPSPSAPSSATSWKGAYSSWGYDLYKSGRYKVSTNKYALTDSSLAGVDVLVVPEPNKIFSTSEIQVLQRFVSGGGGLFLMANHWGSDRDNDGAESVSVWEQVLAGFSPSTGISLMREKRTDDPCGNLVYDPDDPVLHGPFGDVRYMGFNGATEFIIDPVGNSSLRGIVWPDSQIQGPSKMFALRGRYGEGRIVAIGDSAPADDGTGTSGDELYDSWNLPDQDNDTFHLNATAWLAVDSGG